MKKFFSYLILIVAQTCAAASLDTLIVGDGTPGPYPLANVFMDTSTLSVVWRSPAREGVLPFVYIFSENGILFSAPLTAQDTLMVHAKVRFQGIPRYYRLFDPRCVEAYDTLGAVSNTSQNVVSNAHDQNLDVSGFRSIGVSVGENGGVLLEQAMDVSLWGIIGNTTRLEGHIADQGVSLDGETREVGDIDRLYLTLINPHFTMTAGDQFVNWTSSTLLSGSRKIVGLSARSTGKAVNGGAFVALSRGNWITQIIRGSSGLQGPYKLTGRNEGAIRILAGTISCSVNGVGKKENDDWSVDNEQASVTFTPRTPIADGDIIEMRYEYSATLYNRTMTGADFSARSRDSLAFSSTAIWYDADDPAHPLDVPLSDADRDSLSAAGDTPYRRAAGRPVNWLAADSVAALTPVYELITGADSVAFYRFAGIDSFSRTSQLYEVDFSENISGGTYVHDSLVCPQYGVCYDVYRYVGIGGRFSPLATPLFAPQQSVRMGVTAGVRFGHARIATDIAGTLHDQNLLSRNDDGDNGALAATSNLTLGEVVSDKFGIWGSLSHTYSSKQFTGNALSATVRRSEWNDTTLITYLTDRQYWDATLGSCVTRGFSLGGGVGQQYANDSLVSTRVSGNAQFRRLALWGSSFSARLFLPKNTLGATTRSFESITDWNLKSAQIKATLQDNWTWGNLPGRGNVSMGLMGDLPRYNLHEKVSVRLDRASSTGEINARDTVRVYAWEQRANLAPHALLSTMLHSSYQQQHTIPTNHTSSTALYEAQVVLSSVKGISAELNWRVNSEHASLFIQQPRYVGVGGDYTLDTTKSGDRFVPRDNGAWQITERELTDESDRRMRKTSARLIWNFETKALVTKGFLKDTRFTGSAQVEENLLDPQELPVRSWIPSATILGRLINDSLIPYADLSYRQSLVFAPESTQLTSELSTRPFLRIVRGYSESGHEEKVSLEKKLGRFTMLVTGGMLALKHIPQNVNDVYTSEYQLSDRFAEVNPQFDFGKGVSAGVKGAIGVGIKQPLYSGTGNYLRGGPVIRWNSGEKGIAEFSYVYSRYDVAQTLDYRLAQGFGAGDVQSASAFADVKTGEHFSISLRYRLDVSKSTETGQWGKPVQNFSTTLKAYL